MRARWKITVLVAPLLFTVGCGQSDEASDIMEMKQAYSLCANTDDARQRLHEQVRKFADQQQAQLFDRGVGVQKELSALRSEVLKNTGGDPVLLTVDKKGKFLVSVSNLGLKEKFVLTVTLWGGMGEDSAVTRLIADLKRFWTIQKVDGGVTNDPPC
jgi:hypothetical protein